MQIRSQTSKGRPQKLRRNDRDHNLRVRHCSLKAGDFDLCRQREARKKKRVLTGGVDLFCLSRAVRPERDLVTTATMKRKSDGGSPRSGTQNDNAAHAAFLPEPRRA